MSNDNMNNNMSNKTMTELAQQVRYFMRRAKQPIGHPNFELCARLIAEEALETITALGFNIKLADDKKFELVPNENKPDIEQIVDGLADTMYVCEWAFANLGLPDKPFLDEVCHNNNLKVIDPKFDENGKVVKPKDHPKPQIKKLLIEMPKYKHNCNSCEFIASFFEEDEGGYIWVDYYNCDGKIIARFGDEENMFYRRV